MLKVLLSTPSTNQNAAKALCYFQGPNDELLIVRNDSFDKVFCKYNYTVDFILLRPNAQNVRESTVFMLSNLLDFMRVYLAYSRNKPMRTTLN